MADSLTNDLVVAFGFSKSNAATAVWLYRNNRMNESLAKYFFHLETRKPFSGIAKPDREMPSLLPGCIEALEHLNFIITEARGSPV